jgi:hypothetical protein
MVKGENAELIPPFDPNVKKYEDLEIGHFLIKIGIKVENVYGSDGMFK